jgi:hypothetical protein
MNSSRRVKHWPERGANAKTNTRAEKATKKAEILKVES